MEERCCRSQTEEEGLWNGGGMLGCCEKAASRLSGYSTGERGFQSAGGLEAEGQKLSVLA